MKNRDHSIKSVFSIGCIFSAVALMVAGCGDKNMDDYNRARVNEEIAKVNTAKGVYRGSINSTFDNHSMGTMTLELSPDTQINSTADNPDPTRMAVIQGVITIEKDVKKFLTFSNGFYDAKSGELQLKIPVLRRNGLTVNVELSAKLINHKFAGTILAHGFADDKAQFSLDTITPLKTAPVVAVKDANALPKVVGALVWSGTNAWAGPGLAVETNLKIKTEETSTDEEFLEIFLPEKLVDVTLTLTKNIQLPFAISRWDLRKGTLHGTNNLGVNGTGVTLDCWQVQLSGGVGWTCDYQADNSNFTLQFPNRVQ